MAAFPTVKMVNECLKKFHTAKGVEPSFHLSPEIANKTIDLSCNISLPGDWEQMLDIKTGTVFYVNENIRTKVNKETWEVSYYCGQNPVEGFRNVVTNEHNTMEQVSAVPLPMAPPPPPPMAAKTLQMVSCKRCSKYLMVEPETAACPNCKGMIVSFIQERCME